MKYRMEHLTVMFLLTLASLGVLAEPLTADKPTDLRSALDDLTWAATNHGYQLVKVQPIDNALIKRGYDNPHVRVAFIGRADQVDLAMSTSPELLNLLPLRLILVERDGSVRIESDNLAAWEVLSPRSRELIEAWQDDLRRILEDYKNGWSAFSPP